MTQRVSSGVPFESVVGYSRAVAAGDHVWVSGCTAVVDGVVVHHDDMERQARQAISNVAAALAGLGLGLGDVVRTRMFVTDISRWEEVARAHREAFAAAPPATSMVEVRRLIDPAMLVEVEAVAYRAGVGGEPRG